MKMRYVVSIYCAGAYCGQWHFKTLAECYMFIDVERLCNRAIIKDFETGKKQVIEMTREA